MTHRNDHVYLSIYLSITIKFVYYMFIVDCLAWLYGYIDIFVAYLPSSTQTFVSIHFAIFRYK